MGVEGVGCPGGLRSTVGQLTVGNPFASRRLPPPPRTGWVVAAAISLALFVIGAVLLEMMAGAAAPANFETSWVDRLVPLTWPQPARVLWWLVIAGAAATHRYLLDRLAGRYRWWLSMLYGAPFVAFAAGIAVGAQWATFH